MISAIGRNLGNKLQSVYANRRAYASTAQKLVGGGRKIISALGRANEFASRIGISNPQISGAVGAIQQYGNPILDFTDSELQRVGN